MVLDDVKQQLQEGKRSIRCHEVGVLLESLGFSVRAGSRGGHKIYTHPKLKDFYSGSYNCGHGKNPEIKPAYINKILKNLDTYDAELRECLGGTDDDQN
ncbi:type II toxin-antitoxin system HicA family toxin [Gammaproteobacteria bacterium LSUCC0112]|nr:type II toxin-antitoxin system HicA family toxin [Gammaproteobacteria bacterium LSUCC0112]